MSIQPDILVFMSDQHNATILSHVGDKWVNTPNLDKIAAAGMVCEQAYTSFPLCVPSRMSMLTGQLPSKTGIMTNNGVISSGQATFAHSLAAEGYETVLCGRMHFLGPDQFHGFTKRLVGDFTPCFHGRYGECRADLGPYVGTPAFHFYRHYGGGTSPVLEYDRAVVDAAIDYLSQPHDKPIFMMVGTYGPHHTFVAPTDLYEKYKKILPPPDSDAKDVFEVHPAVEWIKRDFDAEMRHCLRAAYYGLVEHIDIQVGRVYDAWKEYLKRNKHKGTFAYVSDHGEQAGEKDLWGKMSFYETSSKIPMIFEGYGFEDKNISMPCSIMDLGPTLCEIAGAVKPPDQDGISLVDVENDTERFVLSEIYARGKPARMIRYKHWKYVSYATMEQDDQLFYLDSDPMEYNNVINEFPVIAEDLRLKLVKDWNVKDIIETQEKWQRHWKVLSAWGEKVDVPEPYRWEIPESAWRLPKR